MARHACGHRIDGTAPLTVVELEQAPEADPALRDVVRADPCRFGDGLRQQRRRSKRKRASEEVPPVHVIEARCWAL